MLRTGLTIAGWALDYMGENCCCDCDEDECECEDDGCTEEGDHNLCRGASPCGCCNRCGFVCDEYEKDRKIQKAIKRLRKAGMTVS